MKNVLIDSSVWIEFFRGNPAAALVNDLIDSNTPCTNELILAELVPALLHQKQKKLAGLLQSIRKIPLTPDWKKIIDYQTINLKNGINKVGIPDLLIMQNAIQHDASLFSFDRHFELMKKHIPFKTIRL